MTGTEDTTGTVEIGVNALVSPNDVTNRAHDLAGTASEWLDSNSEYFDIFDWKDMKEKMWKRKAFNECALFLINAFDNGVDVETPELKELLIERVNDRRFAQLVQRNPCDFHHFAYPILYTEYVDALDPDVAAAFERVAKRGEFWSSEHLAYRLLEYCYLSRIIGVEYAYDERDIVRYSMVNNQPNVVLSNHVDAYCLTHDVMFCNYDRLLYNGYRGYTGDGTPIPTENYDIGPTLRGLILRYMAEDNIDITLELLLSGVLQRQVSREMARLVLSWTTEKTRDVGFVPGPDAESLSLVSSPKLEGVREGAAWEYDHENNREARWAKHYHTNIVAGITARVLARNWETLDSRTIDSGMEEPSYRRECLRLGEAVAALANYDLGTGSEKLLALTDSPIPDEFPVVFGEAVDFLKDQRTGTGEYGYWTEEEILYTNKDGKSRESFRNDLVKPVSETCRNVVRQIGTDDE